MGGVSSANLNQISRTVVDDGQFGIPVQSQWLLSSWDTDVLISISTMTPHNEMPYCIFRLMRHSENHCIALRCLTLHPGFDKMETERKGQVLTPFQGILKLGLSKCEPHATQPNSSLGLNFFAFASHHLGRKTTISWVETDHYNAVHFCTFARLHYSALQCIAVHCTGYLGETGKAKFLSAAIWLLPSSLSHSLSHRDEEGDDDNEEDRQTDKRKKTNRQTDKRQTDKQRNKYTNKQTIWWRPSSLTLSFSLVMIKPIVMAM